MSDNLLICLVIASACFFGLITYASESTEICIKPETGVFLLNDSSIEFTVSGCDGGPHKWTITTGTKV